MAQKNNKTKPVESALHYGLKKVVTIEFLDGTQIHGTLNYVNKYEYVLKDAFKERKSVQPLFSEAFDKDKHDPHVDEFDSEVVILKSAVKYLYVKK